MCKVVIIVNNCQEEWLNDPSLRTRQFMTDNAVDFSFIYFLAEFIFLIILSSLHKEELFHLWWPTHLAHE